MHTPFTTTPCRLSLSKFVQISSEEIRQSEAEANPKLSWNIFTEYLYNLQRQINGRLRYGALYKRALSCDIILYCFNFRGAPTWPDSGPTRRLNPQPPLMTSHAFPNFPSRVAPTFNIYLQPWYKCMLQGPIPNCASQQCTVVHLLSSIVGHKPLYDIFIHIPFLPLIN